ncbi:uncharacterized protein SCHCODRAFT_02673202 [Schizophyllum commune H4-8]|nr:uncharacterized protein SCHCODRAFT_02673202 [Schizophyllum commune H4-8]KAI5886183.1 hypothetical protein SCHCODRAFT_02673202 [Schizophyllum commune H4-8]
MSDASRLLGRLFADPEPPEARAGSLGEGCDEGSFGRRFGVGEPPRARVGLLYEKSDEGSRTTFGEATPPEARAIFPDESCGGGGVPSPSPISSNRQERADAFALVPAWSPTVNACCRYDEGEGEGDFLPLLAPPSPARVGVISWRYECDGNSRVDALSALVLCEGECERAVAHVLEEGKGLQEGARGFRAKAMAGVPEQSAAGSKRSDSLDYHPIDELCYRLCLRAVSPSLLRFRTRESPHARGARHRRHARVRLFRRRARIARDSLTQVNVVPGLAGALPLLAFPHITSAAIGWQSGDADIDGAVELMCKAWTELGSWWSTLDALAPYIPRVTLRTLIPLARHCPRFKRFFLTNLDLSDIPDPVEVREDERVENRPIVLEFMCSVLSYAQVKPVAAFLTSVFPKGGIERIEPRMSEEMWGRVCASMGINLGKLDFFSCEKYIV